MPWYFMELMDLAQSMSQEEQRYVREGFSSDEEPSIYDLLFSDNLSKSDIIKITKMAVDLLQKDQGTYRPDGSLNGQAGNQSRCRCPDQERAL